MAVTGFNEVLQNLNRAIEEIEGGTRKGMTAAGLFIKGESQQRTPVDAGVMRNSAFASTEVNSRGVTLRVGYTAKYAPWVHEMPMTLRGQPRSDFGTTRAGVSFGGGSGTGVYWQGGENKFLEKAVKENVGPILQIIRNRASV